MKIIFTYLAFISLTSFSFGQIQVPTIKAKSNRASVWLGKQFYSNAWKMSPKPQNDPEELGALVAKEGSLIAIITDMDSIGFMLKQGESRLFRIVLNEKDTVWAEAKGRYPKGNFDEIYKKASEGKTFVEIPSAYELVNIIMAISPTGVRDSDLVEHEIPYYQQVQTYFDAFKTHKAVTVMDSLLKANRYYDIKMDSYNYDFEKGNLMKKGAYNRISWGNDNTIEKYIPLFQDFAEKSNFLRFYKKKQSFYAPLIKAYKDSLGVAEMQNWLNKNFPATHYNCFKIIFSPLVAGNQSATDFESNGFKEAQAHVNFPYVQFAQIKEKLTPLSVNVKRGDIVFTELNHPFENPEFENEQNFPLFSKIPFNMAVFTTKGKPASSYDNPLRCIQEYMNWGLVSLRYVDYAPKEDLEALLKYRDGWMVNYRGFTKFKEFNRFLVDIYTKRPQGKVVADLYPQIIQWFSDNNK